MRAEERESGLESLQPGQSLPQPLHHTAPMVLEGIWTWMLAWSLVSSLLL